MRALTVAALLSSLLSAASAASQPLPEELLGGPGESCRASTDCATGLVCMRNECIVDGVGESCLARADCKAGLHCIKNTCVTQGAPPGPPVAPQGAPPWPAPPSPAPPLAAPPGVGAPQPPGPPAANLPHPPVAEAEPATPATYADWRIGRGTRALVGSNVLPGFGISYAYSSSTATAFFPALLFGLRGGVLFGRTELAAELSPGTWLPSTNGGGVVQANASIGYLAHLAGDFYWPLRFGLGVAGPSLPTALFMQRLDLFGVAYNWSHLLFEAHLPSFRHGTDLSSFSVFDWHFGVEASYVF